MVQTVLFLSFVLSFPIMILAIWLFQGQGGTIFAAWFAFVCAVLGVGGLLRFREELSWWYKEVTGVVIGYEESVKYERVDDEKHLTGRNSDYFYGKFHQLYRKRRYFTPIIEYRWRGQTYQKGSLVKYNRFALQLWGDKVGDKVVMRIPVEHPEKARKKTFLSIYIHLFIGIFLCFLSILMVSLLLDSYGYCGGFICDMSSMGERFLDDMFIRQ